MDENFKNKNSLSIYEKDDKAETVFEIENKVQGQFSEVQGGEIFDCKPSAQYLTIVPQTPYRVKIEVLVRNKTQNGTFTSDLTNVAPNDLIEFKIIATNISNENIYNFFSIFLMQKQMFEFIEERYITIGILDINSEIGNITKEIVKVNNSKYDVLEWFVNTEFSANSRIYCIFTAKIKPVPQMDELGIYGNYNISSTSYTSITKQGSVPSLKISSNYDLYVQKQQSLSPSNNYTNYTIEAINGDIISYKILLKNLSDKTLYNIKITDMLNNHLSYIQGSLVWSGGNAIWNSNGSSNINGKIVGGSIEWTLTQISNINNFNLTFKSEVVS